MKILLATVNETSRFSVYVVTNALLIYGRVILYGVICLAAFLVCIGSDDPYIRYSGYVEYYRNVLDRLYGADRDMWLEVRSHEDKRIAYEFSSFSKFFDKYRENVAATVNTAINNTYIQAHNQPEGVKSYGLVVDLVVNYILYTE